MQLSRLAFSAVLFCIVLQTVTVHSNTNRVFRTLADCPTGQVMVNGSCVNCDPKLCPTNTTSGNGTSTGTNGTSSGSNDTTSCPTGQVLLNGACTCPQGQIMYNGACICDPKICTNSTTNSTSGNNSTGGSNSTVTCPQGTALVNGKCVDCNTFTGTTMIPAACANCTDGTTYSQVLKKCVKCSGGFFNSTLSTCQCRDNSTQYSISADSCVSCVGGYFDSTSNTCKCKTGYFFNAAKGACIACYSSSSNSGNVYYIYNDSACVGVCPTVAPYYWQGRCITCFGGKFDNTTGCICPSTTSFSDGFCKLTNGSCTEFKNTSSLTGYDPTANTTVVNRTSILNDTKVESKTDRCDVKVSGTGGALSADPSANSTANNGTSGNTNSSSPASAGSPITVTLRKLVDNLGRYAMKFDTNAWVWNGPTKTTFQGVGVAVFTGSNTFTISTSSNNQSNTDSVTVNVTAYVFTEDGTVTYGNNSYKVKTGAIKVTYEISAWPFPSNATDAFLYLAVTVTTTDQGMNTTDDATGVMLGNAVCSLPALAYLDGQATKIGVVWGKDFQTSSGTQGFIIFKFPAFKTKIFYDPIVSTTADGVVVSDSTYASMVSDTPSPSTSAPSKKGALTSSVSIIAALVALLCMMLL